MAVYKRNKIWYVYYYIKVNGIHKKKGVAVSPRREEAVALERQYQDLINEGIDPSMMKANGTTNETLQPVSVRKIPHYLKLKQFIPIFMELHGNNQSDNMQESYRASSKHLLPGFGRLRLEEITKVKMQTYMSNRVMEGASHASVNREVAFIKSVLLRAVDWDFLIRNPLQGIKFLKEAPIRERYLTKEEYERLLEVSPNYLSEIIVFALATGFRKAEIFNLRWQDVKINPRFKYGEITVVGKGDKRRNIRMNKTVYNMLILKQCETMSEYVFYSPKTGNKFDNVDKSFKTALRKAGINNFRFHDLRHTAASWMIQCGADIYAVQKILGHSHIRTTQRYAHQSPEYLENQIGVLDEILDLEKTNVEKEPGTEKELKLKTA